MNELYCNEHLDISSTLNLKRHDTNKLNCKCCGKKFNKQICKILNYCLECLPSKYLENPYIDCNANFLFFDHTITRIIKINPKIYFKLNFSDKIKFFNFAMYQNIVDISYYNNLMLDKENFSKMLPPSPSLSDLFFSKCQLCDNNNPCISRRLDICSNCLPKSYLDNPYIDCCANQKGIKNLILKNILKEYPLTYKKLSFIDKNNIDYIRIVLMYNTNIIKDFETLKIVITYIPQFINQSRLWDDLKKYGWKDYELATLKPKQIYFLPNYQHPFYYVR